MSFDCLEVALEAVSLIGPVAQRVAERDRSLAEQIRRAASSVPSNINEGVGNAGGRRTEHYRIALGSAREVVVQLRIAVAWGYVADVSAPLALLDRVCAMLWRLTR